MDNINFEIGGINNQITDEYGTDNDLEVTGGGKGWTATTTLNGEVITVKATSKLGAALAMLDYFEGRELDGIIDESNEDMTEAEQELLRSPVPR